MIRDPLNKSKLNNGERTGKMKISTMILHNNLEMNLPKHNEQKFDSSSYIHICIQFLFHQDMFKRIIFINFLLFFLI